jgi:glycerol-3-phosphate dehydrogenase subunit B
MAIESETLVVGGGLAGCLAALGAARNGDDVLLVSHKQSTLRQASGLIDVLGYQNGDLVADPFAAIAETPAGHPYERVGVETVREALSVFDEAVPNYQGAHTDRNALVPTTGGTVKPTARYPTGTAAGLASRRESTLLVGFETLVDFDAPLAARHLERAGVPFDVRGVTLTFPGEIRADADVPRYARVLESDGTGGTDSRELTAPETLAQAVRPQLEDATRIGFPAILGDRNPGEVRETLESHLGVPVFEIPMGPPSIPGLRLERALFDALDDAGVRIETGNPVVDFEANECCIEHALVERTHQQIPYSAEQFVLATGGLVGKGIDSSREGVLEPVFDCHIPHPDDRYDWVETDAFGDHPFARFGVEVDHEMRPRDATGTPEYGNLRAAGAVLGGADFPAEKSGSGISIATGYRAGTLAGES